MCCIRGVGASCYGSLVDGLFWYILQFMVRKSKSGINLLLIAIIMMKAVGFSYVMASVEFDSTHCSVVAMGTLALHVQQHMDDRSSVGQQYLNSDDTAASDNSCATPACGAALVDSILQIPRIADDNHFIVIKPSLQGITLPTDIKPPRHFSG